MGLRQAVGLALVVLACGAGGCDRTDGTPGSARDKPGASGSADRAKAPEGASGAATGSAASSASAAESPTPTPSGTASASASAMDATRSELVKVLDPGKDPRQELRLAATVGQAETMQMKMTMDVGVKMAGKDVPKTNVPPMVMTMDMKVTETKPNGDVGYDFKLVKTDVAEAPGIDPKVIKAMEAALGKINGLSGHAVVSNRGFNRGARMNAPPQADPQTKQVLESMEQAMNQVAAPLPAEPVGVGAKWQSEVKLAQAGVNVSQVSTYTLDKLEGRKLDLKVELQQSAPRQKLTPQPGTTVELMSLASKGGGTSKLDLSKLSPLHSLLTLQSDVTMALPQNQPMSMTTKLTIDISSK